jgi:solute carrier family 24 (sodium/potassium/calcium exchanger), member 6
MKACPILLGIFSSFLLLFLSLSDAMPPKLNLKRTDLGFLDSLSSTATSSEATSPTSLKSPTKHQSKLETITENEAEEEEEEEEEDSSKPLEFELRQVSDSKEEEKDSSARPAEKASSTKAALNTGPSEEDRIIDDKLKFMVGYYDIYEQIGGPNDPWRRFGFIAVMTLILIVLFYLMYSISSDYLTPSLSHLSGAFKMSPDMAGLTFLAFGNGAPDLFTAMLGAEDAPEMILGSSIGSGLFIFTVVFGLVICFAKDPGVPSTSATAVVLSFPSPKDSSRVKIGRGTFWRNALMYAGCVLALAVFVLRRQIPFWQPFVLVVLFFVYLLASISAHYLLRGKRVKSLRRESEKGSDFVDDEATANSTPMQLIEIERKRHEFQQLSFRQQSVFMFCECTGWREMGLLERGFWILTSPLRLALNLTIIPLPDHEISNNPDRIVAQWICSRLLITVNPLGSCLLLGWLSGAFEASLARFGLFWTGVAYTTLTLLLMGLFHLGSNSISNPLAGTEPNWRKSLPLWAATLFSFTACIAWIFAVSNELVAALSSLGLVLGVSRTVMGCLVLAWGNSIGDLIADLALARNGAPQTAITAIFSGPVQNVLLTIGISFMAAAVQSPNKTIQLAQLRGDVHLSLALLIIVICGCLVIIPGYFKYRIPRQFGVALILLYIFYVPFNLWLGLSH